MASWLVRSSLDRGVRVRALAGDIVLCFWARHFTISVSLHPSVYMGTATLMLWVTLWWTSIPSRGGVDILLVVSCYRNRDKLRPDGPLGWHADYSTICGVAKSIWDVNCVTLLRLKYSLVNEDPCWLVDRLNTSELVTLQFGSTSTSVRCQMGDFGCGDGGWTPVMKIDGNKVGQ